VVDSGINRAQLEGVRAYLKAVNPNKHTSVLADVSLAQYARMTATPAGILSLTADVQPNQPFNWMILEKFRLQLKEEHPNSEKLIDELGYDALYRFYMNPNLDLSTELGRK
jgi:hypothetical protein